MKKGAFTPLPVAPPVHSSPKSKAAFAVAAGPTSSDKQSDLRK